MPFDRHNVTNQIIDVFGTKVRSSRTMQGRKLLSKQWCYRVYDTWSSMSTNRVVIRLQYVKILLTCLRIDFVHSFEVWSTQTRKALCGVDQFIITMSSSVICNGCIHTLEDLEGCATFWIPRNVTIEYLGAHVCNDGAYTLGADCIAWVQMIFKSPHLSLILNGWQQLDRSLCQLVESSKGIRCRH